jgi:hypothetical protein
MRCVKATDVAEVNERARQGGPGMAAVCDQAFVSGCLGEQVHSQSSGSNNLIPHYRSWS